MKLDVKQVVERIEQTRDERREYVRMARRWENAWTMKIFDKTAEQRLEEEGKEQVTLPTVYNAVHLAQRLLGSQPKIEIPKRDKTEAADRAAKLRERWINAVWQTMYLQRRRNFIQDASWQLFVRGRAVMRVLWVYPQLPKMMQNRVLPFKFDLLDPVDCGFRDGPLFPEYAYSTEIMPITSLIQMYPKGNLEPLISKHQNSKYFNKEEVEVTDFWYTDKDGAVWHTVIANNQVDVLPPRKTDYPVIPLYEIYGDSAGVPSETYRGLSLIHPMDDLYRYQCRLASQIATGTMYYMWPLILFTNEFGAPINPEFSLKPGGWEQLPSGTQWQLLQPSPNVPLAQSISQQVESSLQQAAFPGVLFGEAPGDLQAGYGINLLGEAARGRISLFRAALEFGIMWANELIFALVETFAPRHMPQGVTAYGRSAGDSKPYHCTLRPEDILGQYENIVSIKPTVPQDEIQRLTIFMRMVGEGLISPQTFRDTILNLDMPEDEQWRIWLAQTLNSPELKGKVYLSTLMQYFPDTWMEWIKGTPLEQLVNQMLGLSQPQPQQQMPPQMPPQQMPPQAGPMPMPQVDMTMPSDVSGSAIGASPMQPENPGAGILPGVIPPELAGQITPEMLGNPNIDPILFAQLMGKPMTPGEQDEQILGV
jgi:hypothetical protein